MKKLNNLHKRKLFPKMLLITFSLSIIMLSINVFGDGIEYRKGITEQNSNFITNSEITGERSIDLGGELPRMLSGNCVYNESINVLAQGNCPMYYFCVVHPDFNNVFPRPQNICMTKYSKIKTEACLFEVMCESNKCLGVSWLPFSTGVCDNGDEVYS